MERSKVMKIISNSLLYTSLMTKSSLHNHNRIIKIVSTFTVRHGYAKTIVRILIKMYIYLYLNKN